MLRAVYSQTLKTGAEFSNIYESIVVFVEQFHKVNSVLLQVAETGSLELNLLNNFINGSFRECLHIVFHVLFGVLISFVQHEFESN